MALAALTVGLCWAHVPPAAATFPGENGLIAYVGWDDGFAPRISVATPDGRRASRVGKLYGASLSWSPDGRRVAFVSSGRTRSHVRVVHVKTGKVQRLRQGYEPAWSPDGRQIAFSRGGRQAEDRIYIMDSNGRRVRRLVTGARSPAWSPGDEIVFTESRRVRDRDGLSTRPEGLSVIKPDGSGRRQLTPTPPPGDGPSSWSDEEPNWSPDGRQIIFTRNAQDLSKATDGDASPHRRGPALEALPALSADRAGGVAHPS